MNALATVFSRSVAPPVNSVLKRLGGIRVRLAIWYLALMLALLAFFVGLLVTTYVDISPYYQDHLMLQLGEQLAATYRPETGQVQLQHALPGAGDGVVVVDSTGRVTQTIGQVSPRALASLSRIAAGAKEESLAETTNYPLATGVAGATTATYDVWTIAVLQQDRHIATIVLASPSGAISGQVPWRSVWPGVLGLLILLTALAGGFWLITRALRPVRLVTQTAREISMSDLSRRINVTSSDELGELAATFDQMLGRLEAAFARQRHFTADASHELRAPLTVIQLEAARMLEQPSTHQECLDALAEIRGTSAAMSTLVDDLLLLARADDDTLTRKAEELDLSDRAYEVSDRLVPMAHQRHLQLVLGSLPAVPVSGDPAALDRAIGNVIENAIKYTSGVGHRVTIETGRRLNEGELWGWLEVTDDGPGITPDHLPHVFERFYRADSARTPSSATDEEIATTVETPVKGTGLGLSIAQSVATSHGGEIQIHSNPGEGCRVILSLPLAQYRLIS